MLRLLGFLHQRCSRWSLWVPRKYGNHLRCSRNLRHRPLELKGKGPKRKKLPFLYVVGDGVWWCPLKKSQREKGIGDHEWFTFNFSKSWFTSIWKNSKPHSIARNLQKTPRSRELVPISRTVLRYSFTISGISDGDQAVPVTWSPSTNSSPIFLFSPSCLELSVRLRSNCSQRAVVGTLMGCTGGWIFTITSALRPHPPALADRSLR